MSKEHKRNRNSKAFDLDMGHAGIYKPWVARRDNASQDRVKG